jgi:Ca-activated chloride channel homolog
MNAGPDAAFEQIDFAQLYMDTQNREIRNNAEQRAQRQHMVDSGVVSALDLDAPDKAVEEFNRASSLLKEQHSKQAITHLQKALASYPKFVLAHNALGLAYLDQQDERAKGEFEAAAKLDDKFPGSFLNLGLLALSVNDFAAADSNLEKAAALSPNDTKILSALAFAQNGDHQYQKTLQTTQRVHALEHQGMGNVHYIAAAAAMALNDSESMQHELNLFLSEDPNNPLAPIARKNLDILLERKSAPSQPPGAASLQPAGQAPQPLTTSPNTERLRSELSAVAGERESGTCETCSTPTEPNANPARAIGGGNSNAPLSLPISAPTSATGGVSGVWTIRQVVDETALFFSVSSHGQMRNDLDTSDLQIIDDGKPPEKILQFVPQSKLPLRLGLLVDTSGSVRERLSFEKRAAARFLQKVLDSSADLGFVAGFSSEITVTQDFTAGPAELERGLEKLTSGGGTSLFDAVAFGCWKLAAYPERGRVARVLVILSDGEDNSSHRSLKQVIEDAETMGVTVYTISTREDAGFGAKTDADKILEVLAERSGGDAMFPGDMLTLHKSLDKLQELIRSRYLVVYRATDFVPNGKYRPVHITVEKNGKRLQVHARKGYYARLEAPDN